MPPERTPTTTLPPSIAPYHTQLVTAPEPDLRVDDLPLFRAEDLEPDSPAESQRRRQPSPVGSAASSAEDNSFRRDFNAAVYECVASYGQIGRLIGHPRHSRMVGAALKALPARLANPYLPQTVPPDSHLGLEASPLPPPLPNPDFVPWHRVVASSGLISPRGNPAATRRQAEWLIAEGVTVLPANGEAATLDGGRVRMSAFGWSGPTANAR
ncbi:Alkyltransferase-like protein 1 [Rhodotorula sphaerocarpa]